VIDPQRMKEISLETQLALAKRWLAVHADRGGSDLETAKAICATIQARIELRDGCTDAAKDWDNPKPKAQVLVLGRSRT